MSLGTSPGTGSLPVTAVVPHVIDVRPMRDRCMLQDLRLEALKSDATAFVPEVDEALRTEQEWQAVLDRGVWWYATCDGEVAGLARVNRAEDGTHVESVWVDVHHRRRGVASRIMTEVARAEAALGTDRIKVWVLEHNDAARALYERLGFVPTGERQPLRHNPAVHEIRLQLRFSA